MINKASITQWSKQIPWSDNAQIEQDLIISRTLVAIYSDEFLASQLAFRGGTALHKLYLSPQPRYSEDIDLVQILVKIPFEVDNSWFSGKCQITTYRLNELLGTKLRALYQRKKGRDLFDLYIALTEAKVNPDEILQCYNRYMGFVVKQPPTYKQFINNMEEKMSDPDFLGDTQALIHPDREFDLKTGYELVKKKLIDKLKR